MKLPFKTDTGIGTRANFGVIVLQADETLESEFRRMMPADGVGLYVSRITMEAEVGADTLSRMEGRLPQATDLLPEITFDAIGFGCTSAATVIGPARVADAISGTRSGARVTEPLSAIVTGARALGAERLAFVTPYVPEVSSLMRARLVEAGFSISAFASFEESDDRVVARISPASILSAIETVAGEAACDAVVVSCTNLRCLDVIAEAEARTGVPVIASNQAMAWHMLRLAGLGDVCEVGGALHRAPLPA